MSLNWSLSLRDAHQSRLEGLDGRGHNDSSRQLVPNPNSSREETVVEGIDTPSWNTELTTVSSRILSVWSQVQFFIFISFHLFAENIAIYKADTVILGCRSPQGNNLLRGAYVAYVAGIAITQSIDYSVHHHSSGLVSMYFQCIPTQCLHHNSWTSFAARRTSRLTVWPAPVIHHRSCCTFLNLYGRPTGWPSFTARLVGCSLRAPWAGVANLQTDRHRAKVTVGAYMWAYELPVIVLA